MARLNRKFAWGLNADGVPDYAPNAFNYEGRDYLHPTDADYAAARFLPVVDEVPGEPAPEGYHYEAISWTEFNGAIRRVYAPVQDPLPPPKAYSTSDLIYALMERGVYATCRQWIEEQGYLDLVLATKEFTDDLESFATIKAGLQTLLDYADEQVAEILAEAEVG